MCTIPRVFFLVVVIMAEQGCRRMNATPSFKLSIPTNAEVVFESDVMDRELVLNKAAASKLIAILNSPPRITETGSPADKFTPYGEFRVAESAVQWCGDHV